MKAFIPFTLVIMNAITAVPQAADLAKGMTSELKTQLVEVRKTVEDAKANALASQHEAEKAATLSQQIESKMTEKVEMARVAALKAENIMGALKTDLESARNSAEAALVSSTTAALKELNTQAIEDAEKAISKLRENIDKQEDQVEHNIEKKVRDIAFNVLNAFQWTMENRTMEAIISIDAEANRVRSEAALLAARASIFAMRATQEGNKARQAKSQMETAMTTMADAAESGAQALMRAH